VTCPFTEVFSLVIMCNLHSVFTEKVKIADAWLGIYPSLADVTGTLVERVGSVGWSVELEGS
jgi:hypothetical protein